jgi:hypothetical protein
MQMQTRKSAAKQRAVPSLGISIISSIISISISSKSTTALMEQLQQDGTRHKALTCCCLCPLFSILLVAAVTQQHDNIHQYGSTETPLHVQTLL